MNHFPIIVNERQNHANEGRHIIPQAETVIRRSNQESSHIRSSLLIITTSVRRNGTIWMIK